VNRDGPWSLHRSLRPAHASEVKLFQNVSSFDETKLTVFWESSTTCVLEAKSLPVSSMWKEEGCELTLSTGLRTNSKKGIKDGKLRMKNLTEFEPITATYSSNGGEKTFVFDPPFTELALSQEGIPTIRYKRGGGGICRTVPNRLAVVINGVKHESRLSGKNVGQYEFPIEWYEQLELPEKISVELSGNHYQSTHEFEIEPPQLTYFQPQALNVEPTCSPEDGYSVKFNIEPLSPLVGNFSAQFVQSDGVKREFDVLDGVAIINFNKNGPVPNELEKISIAGHLLLGDYYDPTGPPVPLKFEFSSHCQIIHTDLMRTTNAYLLQITAHNNWLGSGLISLNEVEQYSTFNDAVLRDETAIIEPYSFDIVPGDKILIKPVDLRKKMPILDRIFTEEHSQEVSLKLVIQPFSKGGHFYESVFTLTLSREPEIYSLEQEHAYVEGGEVQIWQFNYLEDYFPEPEKFNLVYAGESFAQFVLSAPSNWSNLQFSIPMPPFSDVQSQNWELMYSGTQLLSSKILIPDITFEPFSEELLFVQDTDTNEIKGPEALGKLNLNGHQSILLHPFVVSGSERIHLPELTVQKPSPNLSSKDLLEYLNKLPSKPPVEGRIEFGLYVPSRGLDISQINVKVSNKASAMDPLVKDWLEQWDKTLEAVEESVFLYEHLRASVWTDLRNVLPNNKFDLNYFLGNRKGAKFAELFLKTDYCSGILDVNGPYDTRRNELLEIWRDWFNSKTEDVEIYVSKLESNTEFKKIMERLIRESPNDTKLKVISRKIILNDDQLMSEITGVYEYLHGLLSAPYGSIKNLRGRQKAVDCCLKELTRLRPTQSPPSAESSEEKSTVLPEEEGASPPIAPAPESKKPQSPIKSRRKKNPKKQAPKAHRGGRKKKSTPPPSREKEIPASLPKEEVDKLYATRDHWKRRSTNSGLRNSEQSAAKTQLQQHIKKMKKQLGDDYRE